ncbi:MAG: hypothetical protein JRJ19_04250 [Deltaproteobacteria bacterium]|nr:hypothetical protein [Deltaproteobacteria bacterium]
MRCRPLGLILAVILMTPFNEAGAGELAKLKPSKTVELLNGRLSIRVPDKTKLEPRRASIMAAEESSAEESRLVLQLGKEKLVLMVYEMFALQGKDLGQTVNAYVKSWKSKAGETFKVTRTSTPLADSYSIVPSALDTTGEAIFVQGVLCGHTDGTTQYLAFYLNPTAAKDVVEIRKLIRSMSDSLRIGKTKLSIAAGDRKLDIMQKGRHLVIKVPDGWSNTHQEGPDFLLHRLHKLAPLGAPAPAIGVYVGGHPSYYHRRIAAAKKTLKQIKGKLLGQSVEWQDYSVPSPDGKTTTFSREVFLRLPDSDRLLLHISASAQTKKDLTNLIGLLEKLKLVKGK